MPEPGNVTNLAATALLVHDGENWCAMCPGMNISAGGDTVKAAYGRLCELVVAYLAFSVENGRFDEMFDVIPRDLVRGMAIATRCPHVSSFDQRLPAGIHVWISAVWIPDTQAAAMAAGGSKPTG